MARPEGDAVVCICDVQFRNLDGTLGCIRLPDILEDAGGNSPKLHQLRGNLSVGIVINTMRALIVFFRNIKVEALCSKV